MKEMKSKYEEFKSWLEKQDDSKIDFPFLVL